MTLPSELESLVGPLLEGHARLRRRRRQRKRLVAFLAPVAAAVLATAALAAKSDWVFSGSSDSGAFARTSVVFHGKTYTVAAGVSSDGRWFSIWLLASGGRRPLAVGDGGSILAAPGVPPERMLPHPRASGHAALGTSYSEGGGEIWIGDARTEVARIVLTDTQGATESTETVRPPSDLKSVFRFWVVALPYAHAVWIAAYDVNGRLIERRRLFATPRMALY